MKQNVHYEKASPTLLAEQGNDATPPAPARGWDRLRDHLETRIGGLRAWRFSWWTTNWSDLSQYILPRRSIWLTQSAGGLPTPNNMSRGREINNSILDPTGTYAARICASGLMSGLASPSRPWFKIMPSMWNLQLDSDSRMWLDEAESRVYSVLASSNFYNAFAQECEDLTVFGTAPNIIYEDAQDVIRCYNPTIGEYYLASDATMRINGLFRMFVMTVNQIVDFFGIDDCPKEIQQLWEAKGAQLDQERTIAHAIEPNFEIQGSPMSQVKGDFSWREVYWVYASGCEAPLSIRGFTEQPFTSGRWYTQSNDSYGRSVGMDVLPDIKQLQRETARKAEAIEKQVRPPLLAHASLKNQPSSILPGHVTYAESIDNGNGMRPIYNVNPDITGMMNDLAQIQERIKQGFFNDLFLLLSNAAQGSEKLTAYQAAQMAQEKLQALGPVIESLMNESLKPKLKRIFGIMKRKGLLPPIPDQLKGQPLDIQFISILALAQKASSTASIERVSAFVGNLAAVFPEARMVFNPENSIREMSDLLGAPQKILNGPQEVAQMKQQADQQQKQVQAAQMAQHVAQTASIGADAASTLASTQIGGGSSALSQMLGQGK